MEEPVKIRFIIQEVSKREYENTYSLHPDKYIPIFRKKTLHGIKTGAKLLVKIADVGNWRENYLAEHGGYRCNKCQDTGVNHYEKGWVSCPACSFGETVRRYYKSKSGVNAQN